MTNNSPSANRWVIFSKRAQSARIRLFCFPYAGGGASIFQKWSDRLPAEIEVCPIQLPGRQSRLDEAPYHRLRPLVQALALALTPYLDLPFAFFGHSMGALISFALARYLRKQNQPAPVHLFVSAFRAPHLPNPYLPLHTLPTPALIEALFHLNGIPHEVLQSDELMRLVLPALRADLALCERYVYSHEAPLRCPISAFGGVGDPRVNHFELSAWRQQTFGPFSLQMFAGDHFFLNGAQSYLLQAIARRLQQAFTSE